LAGGLRKFVAAGFGSLLAAAAMAAEAARTVTTGGNGELTMCRSWLLFSTCHDYHHIPLPARVSVGDTLHLRFGSNQKDYNFPVGHITVDGDRCTLLGDGSGNKIEAAPCRWAAK
jgi:hypothetical protein